MKVLKSQSHLILTTTQVSCQTKRSQQQNWLTLFFFSCFCLIEKQQNQDKLFDEEEKKFKSLRETQQFHQNKRSIHLLWLNSILSTPKQRQSTMMIRQTSNFLWTWHNIVIKDWIWVFWSVWTDLSIFERKKPNALNVVSQVCSFIYLKWSLDQLRFQCEKKGISIWIPSEDELSVFIVIMSINEESVNNHSVDFDDQLQKSLWTWWFWFLIVHWCLSLVDNLSHWHPSSCCLMFWHNFWHNFWPKDDTKVIDNWQIQFCLFHDHCLIDFIHFFEEIEEWNIWLFFKWNAIFLHK